MSDSPQDLPDDPAEPTAPQFIPGARGQNWDGADAEGVMCPRHRAAVSPGGLKLCGAV